MADMLAPLEMFTTCKPAVYAFVDTLVQDVSG